jgi:hypothetical protein
MSGTKYKDCVVKLPFMMNGKLMAVGADVLNGFRGGSEAKNLYGGY